MARAVKRQDVVALPRELLEEILLSLDLALGRIETLDPDPGFASLRIHERGEAALSRARRAMEKAR